MQAVKAVVDTTWQGLDAKVDPAGCGCCRNIATGIDRIKLPKFYGDTSWAVFCCQFEVIAGHNEQAPQEKPHSYLLFCRNKPLTFYTASLQKQHTKRLLRHLRVTMRTTSLPLHTIPR
jgi:hypothetical protein